LEFEEGALGLHDAPLYQRSFLILAVQIAWLTGMYRGSNVQIWGSGHGGAILGPTFCPHYCHIYSGHTRAGPPLPESCPTGPGSATRAPARIKGPPKQGRAPVTQTQSQHAGGQLLERSWQCEHVKAHTMVLTIE
jgi:hypothetical protein